MRDQEDSQAELEALREEAKQARLQEKTARPAKKIHQKPARREKAKAK